MNKFQSFGWEINPNLSDFKTSFPSLNKDIKTDWLIIGGGLTGLSALNQLKKQNASDTITITVAPPSDAIAGEVGVISIRISNGNGAGQIVEQVPVRIGSVPGIVVDSKGPWKVNTDVASWPTAWVENIGNDVAIMDLSIQNLPTGWTATGESVIVLAPGEVLGMAITSNWILRYCIQLWVA